MKNSKDNTSVQGDVDFEERLSATELYLELARQKVLEQGEQIAALRERHEKFADAVSLLGEMLLTQIGIKNARQTVKEFLSLK